jgi:hypothetical protein
LQSSEIVKEDMPYDSGNGERQRYYRPDLKLEQLMSRLIMYGYHVGSRGDLSFGCVRGFNNRSYETHVNVGFFENGIRKTPSHK